MKKQIVRHPDMPAPCGACSTAVRARGVLFVSGQAGIDPANGRKAGDSFESLKTCPECSGASMEDVVKVIAWLGDPEERAALDDLFGE